MKTLVNYIICSAALFVAAALVLGGAWWTFLGLLWCALLYISGDLYPTIWRRFWVANMRILRYFDCL